MRPLIRIISCFALLIFLALSSNANTNYNNRYYANINGAFAPSTPIYNTGTLHSMSFPNSRYRLGLNNSFQGNFNSKQINYTPIVNNSYSIPLGQRNLNLFMNNAIPVFQKRPVNNNVGAFFSF